MVRVKRCVRRVCVGVHCMNEARPPPSLIVPEAWRVHWHEDGRGCVATEEEGCVAIGGDGGRGVWRGPGACGKVKERSRGVGGERWWELDREWEGSGRGGYSGQHRWRESRTRARKPTPAFGTVSCPGWLEEKLPRALRNFSPSSNPRSRARCCGHTRGSWRGCGRW